jgi:hypothetical protein
MTNLHISEVKPPKKSREGFSISQRPSIKTETASVKESQPSLDPPKDLFDVSIFT